MITVAALAALLPEATVQGNGTVRIESLSTDTRNLTPGALFVALRGARFDGHAFAAGAAAAGAVALLVDRPLDSPLPQIVVPDTLRALGHAAAAWRARFALPVIAVTGSNGKTTVTQMIAAILTAAHGEGRRLATRGNLNNAIGLPLTLLRLRAAHRAAVVEVGMNQPGEIRDLAAIAQPTIAVVTNAQREHQEFLAGVEATARENGAAIAALPPDGVAVFPADDRCAPIWRQLAGTRRVLDFARHGAAAVTAQYRLTADGADLAIATPAGPLELRLPVPGEHAVHNALAAVAAALAAAVPIGAIRGGLAAFAPVAGRGVRRPLPGGGTLIDDSYNANPDSVRAAIDLLTLLPAPRVLVLGDMGEVGPQGPSFHREVGAYARERGLDALITIGVAAAQAATAFGAGAYVCGDAVERAADLAAALGSGGSVLVKGSRFMRMERVAEQIMQRTPAGAH